MEGGGYDDLISARYDLGYILCAVPFLCQYHTHLREMTQMEGGGRAHGVRFLAVLKCII